MSNLCRKIKKLFTKEGCFCIGEILGFHKHLSDEKFIIKKFNALMPYKINLDNPKTFNEKLNWLKLYNRVDEYTIFVDKYKVREYIFNKIGDKYLVPLIEVFDKETDIDFSKLPNKFVLKCNHNSGTGMLICTNKDLINKKEVLNNLKKGLKQNYYLQHREWPYKNVERKITCEKYLEDEAGEGLSDYKVLCFNGEPKFIEVHKNRFANHTQDIYDENWNNTHIKQVGETISKNDIPKPIFFNEMMELSRMLSKDIPHVRVDWYYTNGQLYFSELTFFDGAGFVPFENYKDDLMLGELIKLPEKK